MTPGVLAQIKSEWRHCYRAPGTPMAGIVQAVSPSGTVARIRFDQLADSYILVPHLEAAAEVAPEPEVLTAA